MLGLKLNHVSKRGHRVLFVCTWTIPYLVLLFCLWLVRYTGMVLIIELFVTEEGHHYILLLLGPWGFILHSDWTTLGELLQWFCLFVAYEGNILHTAVLFVLSIRWRPRIGEMYVQFSRSSICRIVVVKNYITVELPKCSELHPDINYETQIRLAALHNRPTLDMIFEKGTQLN